MFDPRAAEECGSATAEAAVVLPVLLLVLAMALSVLAAVSSQLRCTDAAAVAARAAARGDSAGQVEQAARATAPEGAAISVQLTRETVQVVVTAQVRPLGKALMGLRGVRVSGRAVAAREDLAGFP